MNEPVFLNKSRELETSQDYAFLREKGMEYIQALSGAIWTDHNLHDPGITILEVLCYALTDLGYRTPTAGSQGGIEIKDLLASEDGAPVAAEESGLFPAHEILTSSPLTLLDYRKLLLKIEGIRNAWLDPMQDPAEPTNYRSSEVPIYADCAADALTYSAHSKSRQPNDRLRLSGLYKVLLELEIDEELGSLNETCLIYRVPRGSAKGVVLFIDCADPAFVERRLELNQDISGVDNVVVSSVNGRFSAKARVKAPGASATVLNDITIRVLRNEELLGNSPKTAIKKILQDDGLEGPLSMLWRKQRQRGAAIDAACCVLNAHRNLCEDFLSVDTVAPERIGVCADIDVTPDADLEEVQARVYHAIENYLNPPVRYYSLKEMLSQGICADEIFDAPFIRPDFECDGTEVFTKPGFLKSDELERTELRRVIYVSDIIDLLMDFEEIVSVRNVLLRRYDKHGRALGKGDRWCLRVRPSRQPVLYIEGSKMLFFKNEIPFRARSIEAEKTLDHLRAMSRKAAYVDPHETLDVPAGRYRNTDEFFTIQNDFPLTYGIGEAGLPSNVSEQRVARARQLKAYLTFYDQLLADYLGQLANVRRLLSLDKGLSQTYFPRVLREISGVRESFDDEFFVDKAALEDAMKEGGLWEDEDGFQRRRNRFLNHLMARFAEQFTDYVLMMFDLDGDPLKTGRGVIEDKIDFLREYPRISRERYRAFNYSAEDEALQWDTSENVSGLERRVSRLVGIDDYSRSDLACPDLWRQVLRTRKVGAKHRVVVRSDENKLLFRSVELFDTPAAARAAAKKLFVHMRDEDAYAVDDSGGTGAVMYTVSGGGVTLTQDEKFNTEADAYQGARAVIERYDEILQESESCNKEGMHLIEHILLRPSTDQDRLMGVCMGDDCEACGDEDPYSFRLSVVLPYWPRRFRDPGFRAHFEKTIRSEAPAHVQVRICWVGYEQMREFDRSYRRWLKVKADKGASPSKLTSAMRRLIDVLESLRTVHPAATLHDCFEGDDDNPVRLGGTNLGIF